MIVYIYKRCFISLLWFTGLLSISVSVSVSAITQQQALFQQAVQALQHNQPAQFRALRKQLNTYVLAGYLDALDLNSRIKHLSAADMHSFLAKWGHTPWGARLKWHWIEQAAKDGQWNTFFYYIKKRPRSTKLQCYYYQGQWVKHHKITALNAAAKLWTSPQSRPDACDDLFAVLKKTGRLTPKRIWQRMQLAAQSGQTALAKYLGKQLAHSPYRTQAQQWIMMLDHPEQLTKTQKFPGKTRAQRALIALGLHQILRKEELDLIIPLWHEYRHRFSLAEQRTLDLAMARSVLINYDTTHLIWMDKILKRYPKKSTHLYILRLRVAIFNQNWQQIKQLTDHIPAHFSNRLLVTYWNIRANEQLHLLSKKDLQKAYQNIAKERRFYAFLAAEHAHTDYAMNDKTTQAHSTAIEYVKKQPAMARIREFIALDRTSEARGEWEYLIRRLPKKYQRASARIALEEQWYILGIRSAIISGLHNDLDTRFPLAFREFVTSIAKKYQLKPSLVYAITRQESAFYPEAISSAGAQGLMQLLPKTAQHTARLHHISYDNSATLLNPEMNITLGAAYLQELLTLFDNDHAHAAAAYNAGPNRVILWDKTRSALDLDAWIETIPFYETRAYVKNILAFRIIYHHRLEQQAGHLLPKQSILAQIHKKQPE